MSEPTTIRDLIHEAMLDGDQERYEKLRVIAKRIKHVADLAWEAAAATAHSGSIEGYHRGKAHAYCDVLGDQAWLSQHGVFD